MMIDSQNHFKKIHSEKYINVFFRAELNILIIDKKLIFIYGIIYCFIVAYINNNV